MHRADRRFARRVLTGDARATAAFADRFQRDLLNLFCWLTRDAELAQDLTQDTLARCWESLYQYRGEAALRTWVHRIAFTCLAAHHRGATREQRGRERLAQAHIPQQTEHTGLELRLALVAALDQLPECERHAVVLCKLQGFTLREASAMLDVPVGTVAWQTATAVKKLRDLLGDTPPGEAASAQPEVTPDVSDGTQAVRTER